MAYEANAYIFNNTTETLTLYDSSSTGKWVKSPKNILNPGEDTNIVVKREGAAPAFIVVYGKKINGGNYCADYCVIDAKRSNNRLSSTVLKTGVIGSKFACDKNNNPPGLNHPAAYIHDAK